MQWRIETPQRRSSRLAMAALASLSDYLQSQDVRQWFGPDKLRWFAGALLALLVVQWISLDKAAINCQSTPFAFRPGAQADVTMRVESGRSCDLAARIGSASIENLAVDSAPQFGMIQPRGRTGVVYRTRVGHKGDDFFTIALNGRRDGEAGSMLVRIKVEVE